jgi:hypothetical protein
MARTAYERSRGSTLYGGEPEKRAFTDYYSIQDRYSARAKLDSENTIGGRF